MCLEIRYISEKIYEPITARVRAQIGRCQLLIVDEIYFLLITINNLSKLILVFVGDIDQLHHCADRSLASEIKEEFDPITMSMLTLCQNPHYKFEHSTNFRQADDIRFQALLQNIRTKTVN